MVIGAGVLGAAVAARLAGAGVHVTLLEQDRPGRATSRWSFAWLNSNDKSPRPYHDLNHAGIRAWADLARDLDGAAWYRPAGNLELATSDAAGLAARVRRLTEWGYPARLVDQAEAAPAGGNGGGRGARGGRGSRPPAASSGAVTSSSSPGAGTTGTLASDEALAALREKLSGGQS